MAGASRSAEHLSKPSTESVLSHSSSPGPDPPPVSLQEATASNGSSVPQSPVIHGDQLDGTLNHISPGALLRGSIVFGVLCAFVVIYIAIRACRLRRNRKSARYNVLSTNDETAPLHSDDEEETVFDASGPRR